MKVRKTKIPGPLIIEPDIFYDDRGYFFESFNQKKYQEIGISKKFVQDNQSKSKKGTIRGLHYQIGKNAQGKLVRVVNGKIRDVTPSPMFGQKMSLFKVEFGPAFNDFINPFPCQRYKSVRAGMSRDLFSIHIKPFARIQCSGMFRFQNR